MTRTPALKLLRAISFALALCAGAGVLAGNPIAVKCGKEAPCRLDGEMDKAIWRTAPLFKDFKEYVPRNGNAPPYNTSFQVAYDDNAIYFAIRSFDERPQEIKAPIARHDMLNVDQDYVSVLIDSIGNKKSAQFFRVGASGATSDGIYTADTDNLDTAPDFDWESIIKRLPDGYFVEMRIPYSTLRYAPAASGGWRVMVGRIVPRDQKYVLLSVPLTNDAPNFIHAIQPLDDMVTPSSARFVQIRPTMTLRKSENVANGVRDNENDVSTGADIKARPFSTLVLDATINPDFSQIEFDTPKLNRNVQFALSTPEKRPFFLESSDLLQGPTSSIYTRTISSPHWGVRATWRDEFAGGTLFTASDSGGGTVLIPGPYGTSDAAQPKSQATVARAYWNIGRIALNSMISLRNYRDAGRNSVAGGGISWQMSDFQRIRLQVLHAETTALPNSTGQLERGKNTTGNDFFADYLFRTDTDELTLATLRTDNGYRNDNGFTTQSGYKSMSETYAHTWRDVWGLNELRGYVNGGKTADLDGGNTINSYVTPGLSLGGRNSLEVTLEPHIVERTRVARTAELLRPRYWHGQVTYSPYLWMPKLTGTFDIGRLVDFEAGRVRPGWTLGLNARIRLNDHIELEPLAQRTALEYGSTRVFSETTWRLLGVWHIDQKSALRLITQSHFDGRVQVPDSDVKGFFGRTNARSLTFIHRQSSSTIFYAGYTEQLNRASESDAKSKEFFVKVQLGI